MLKWAEDQQHQEIKAAEIPALKGSLMLDMDPVLLSQRLWSWIQLCLKDDDNMELAFNNVEALNGLEFWRKLVVPQYARTPARRYRLRDLVQSPKGASNFVGTEQALVVWDKDLLAYIAAGAKMPEDEDLVHSMLKMLPALSQEMLAKAHAENTPDKLREWIRLQAEFERENPTRRAAHLVQRGGDDQEQESSHGADDEILELEPDVLALMTAQEVNAFYKSRGFTTVQGGRRNQPGGRRTQTASAGVRAEGERASRPVKCANCGREGHSAADCRKPKVEFAKRRCHNCNEEGHLARDCKKPKAKPALVVDRAAEPAGEKAPRVLMMGNEEDESRAVARRLPPRGASEIPSRPTPQKAVLGDHLVPTAASTSGPGLEMPQLDQHMSQGERKKMMKNATKAGKQRFKPPCGDEGCGCGESKTRSNLYVVSNDRAVLDSTDNIVRSCCKWVDARGSAAGVDVPKGVMEPARCSLSCCLVARSGSFSEVGVYCNNSPYNTPSTKTAVPIAAVVHRILDSRVPNDSSRTMLIDEGKGTWDTVVSDSDGKPDEPDFPTLSAVTSNTAGHGGKDVAIGSGSHAAKSQLTFEVVDDHTELNIETGGEGKTVVTLPPTDQGQLAKDIETKERVESSCDTVVEHTVELNTETAGKGTPSHPAASRLESVPT